MQIYRLSITIGNNNCFFSIKKNNQTHNKINKTTYLFEKVNYFFE